MSEPRITMEMLEKGYTCPHCGGRDFNTFALEGVFQPISNGEWGESDFSDDVFLVEVTCDNCDDKVLMSRASEAMEAVHRVLYPESYE